MPKGLIPEKLINFNVYEDAERLLGLADITLPKFDYMTTTVKGAGIAGEVESPTLGHYGSMTSTLNFRTASPELVSLIEPKWHHIDAYGAIQHTDTATGRLVTEQCKVTMRAMPKSGELGKYDVSELMDSSVEMELNYLKVSIGGKDVFELDKYNYVNRINGTDYLADTREALGLT